MADNVKETPEEQPASSPKRCRPDPQVVGQGSKSTKGKGIPNPRGGKALSRAEARRHKALEKTFERARRLSLSSEHPSREPSPFSRGQDPPAQFSSSRAISPSLEGEGSQVHSPAASLGYPDSSSLIEESCPFEAASLEEGLDPLQGSSKGRSGRTRPSEDQGPYLSVEMQKVIEKAIERGIVSGLTRKKQGASNLSTKSVQKPSQSGQTQGPPSPGTSVATEESVLEEDNVAEQEFSEDETPLPDKPSSSGLFRPSLFKAILHKAKASTQEGTPLPGALLPSGAQDHKQGLFKETAPAQDLVPVPEIFVNVIQRQWAQPGSLTNPSGADKHLYSVETNLEEILKLPQVEAPVISLTSNSVLPADLLEGLKAEDKRAEKACHKTHQAAAWSIKAATAASFFTRASLLWLRQLRANYPSEGSRWMHDLNKIIAAVEYSADASLDAAKFASRALASNVTSRRLLWLRHWQVDVKSKWKLASAPFKGGQLFGDTLEKFLIETKDKRKVLPSTARKADRKNTFFRRQSFRGNDNSGAGPSYQRTFPQGNDRNQDRSSFKDKGRQQQTFRRPFCGGSSNRPYRKTK